jgi:nitrite reductase (cytochrome c-552)
MTGTVIAKAHERLGEAGVNGRLTQENLDKARELLRRAQWYWDMVSAENSMGFHNPGQVMSTLGQSIDLAYRADVYHRELTGQCEREIFGLTIT